VAPCWMEVEFVPAGRAHPPRASSCCIPPLKKTEAGESAASAFTWLEMGKTVRLVASRFRTAAIIVQWAPTQCKVTMSAWHPAENVARIFVRNEIFLLFFPEKETIASSYHAKLCFSKTYRAAPSYKNISFRS
jgi:hypothetical protein